MTPDQYILLHIYSSQKVYMTRILEVVCAIKEQQETRHPPTGILGASIMAEADQLVNSLMDSLTQNIPEDIELGTLHGLSDERLKDWFDKSVYEVFTKDDEEEQS